MSTSRGIEIKNIVEEIVENQNMKSFSIPLIEQFKKDKLVTTMSGSFNEILTVTIQDEEMNRKINVIIKIASKDEEICESFPFHSMIQNEIYFYSMLYPSLVEFVDDMIDSSRKYILLPKYYHHSLGTERTTLEWLAIQNLEPDGFNVLNSTWNLSDDDFKLFFERYGYFNAHSYLLKAKAFDKFNELVSPLQNIVKTFFQSCRFSSNLETVYFAIQNFLKHGEDDRLINYCNKYLINGKRILKECIENVGKYDTIIHGNLWSNHLLFKDDPCTGKPIHMRFIDWKYAKMGSPVCDLSFCFYAGTPKLLLDNLNEYLKIYHNSLTSTLKEFGCWKTDRIFTYEQLLQEWKTYSKFGFLMATQVIFMKFSVIYNQANDASSNPEMMLFRTLKYDEEQFEMTMRDLLNHMVEN